VERVRDALGGCRSPSELFDTFVAALSRSLGPQALVSLYAADDDRAWLEAQRGYQVVVHGLLLDHGVFGRALRTGQTQVVADTTADPDYVTIVDGVTALVAVPFRLPAGPGLLGVELLGLPMTDALAADLDASVGELVEAFGGLSPRARQGSPLTELSRSFVRLASQRDARSLLELAARLTGETLRLDWVLALTGRPDELEPVSEWRRTVRVEPACDAVEASALGAAMLWEPAHAVVTASTVPALQAVRDRGHAAVVLLPLRAGGDVVGLLVGAARAERRFQPEQHERAELLAAQAGAALGNLQRYEDVVAAALTDALTGLPNHRRFHEDGAALLEAARANGSSFAVVVADLDDFKDLNDRRGHVAGDDALRLVGAILAAGIRPDDRAYRLGGEEFGLLLPDTGKSNARTVCRRLQRALAAVDLDGWRLSVSIGVAGFPQDGETVRDLLVAGDAALYEAKRMGKDRITLAEERLSARRLRGDTMAARGRRSFEQMRSLQALTAALGAARTPRDAARIVLQELRAALPHDVSRLYLADADGGFAEAAARVGALDAEGEALLHGLAARSGEEGRPILLDDAGGEGSILGGTVAAPCLADGRLVGAIVVSASIESRFDRDDQRLLDVIAHLAGLAAENLRLVGDLRARLADGEQG
jgi:diguanylate cyclase (GGDEF)-like protein